MSTKFDYIVIGGGLAGLVVASRLSEDPSVSVAVIEAGGDVAHWPDTQVPGFYTKNLTKPEIDWTFFSTPQPGVNNRSIYLPRGKGLGGSSGLNLMALGRASKIEYDAMETLGAKGWNWNSYLQYFKKSETFHADPDTAAKYGFKPDPEFHGKSGPLQKTLPRWISEHHMPYFKAMNSLGVPHQWDSSNGHLVGTGTGMAAIDAKTVTRSSSCSSYYELAKDRPNLTTIKLAHATKVLFTKGPSGKLVATGVEYVQDGETRSAEAKKEVILSAGSFQTPQLLELSGIGDPKILNAHGIPVLKELPGVGANLQDHLTVGFTAEMNPEFESRDILDSDPARAKAEWQLYETKKEGMFSSIATVAYAFLSTKYFADVAKIKKLAEEHSVVNGEENGLKGIAKTVKISKEWLENDEVPQIGINQVSVFFPQPGYGPEHNKRYFSFVLALMHPLSRGTVHIGSTDPLAPPIIDPKYLNNKVDLELLVSGIRFARKVCKTDALKEYTLKEVVPGERVESDEELEKYVKNGLATMFHPVGTAGMMPEEEDGVVDERCVVYGTENLRIIDASIIPIQIAAFSQATVYALAEKAVDIIKGA